MEKENRGRKPNWKRRGLILDLRSQGFTMQEIGAKLGVSKEAVRQQLTACGQRGWLPREIRQRRNRAG
jgi:predicted ArsR family transcriptional regulator